MADVEWTLRAIDDVQHIRNYVARWSEGLAERHVDGLTRTVASLSDFPRLGRTISVINDEAYRELINRSYRIVYRVRGDRVRIIAVLHVSVNLERTLAQRANDL